MFFHCGVQISQFITASFTYFIYLLYCVMIEQIKHIEVFCSDWFSAHYDLSEV